MNATLLLLKRIWKTGLMPGIIFLALGLAFLVLHPSSAQALGDFQAQPTPIGDQETAKSNQPSLPPEATPSPTPSVGGFVLDGNAGLVCGASLLVFITIGGVIWTKYRQRPPNPAA